ncbi:hypothetical protein KIK06_27255 [Nocardiopsis sp. EMB25]|uniref:bacteriocin-associated integral membrane family protein n=1 Tax=Nocardiopsis sp. EMB25 TaxID=2835867 RepID=UPI0022832F64|nr:hypothetical protein [Nocardiopsis sp. EMB25]MCY9787582.1 hypothetical protein [Nocardiopsis sp. EMB25]
MPNRILSFAYSACLAFAAVIAFLLATTAEQTIYVLEDSELVWISENDGTHDNAEVAASVQRIADDHGAAIAYVIPDVEEPSTLVHMYLAVSDPDSRYADWLDSGYPSFSRAMTVQTHPIDAFGDVGPNGHYLVLGAPQAEPALREALAEHGLREATGTTVTQLWHYFTGGRLFNLVAVALLGTVTAVGAGVLLGSREYAVRRLQGHSYLRVLRTDLGRVGRLCAIALPIATAATLGFLGVYNGWNQLGFYTPLALVFLGLLIVPCLLVHAGTLGLVHATGILPALKGRLPVRSTTVAIYLVRVPVLALSLVIVSAIALSAQSAREQSAALELYEEYPDTSRPALSSNYGWADADAVDDALGPWLRRVDADGDMVLAAHQSPLEFVPPDPAGVAPPAIDLRILLVNDTYLAEQEVLAPSGERYGSGDEVRVIIPDSAAEHTEQIVASTENWLSGASESERALDVEVLPAADGQTLFTYGMEGGGRPLFLPLVYEPVLIALPNGQVLSDTSYVTHMSARETIFPAPGVVEEFRASNPQASRYISMVETLTTSALVAHANTLTTLRTEMFNLVGATAVLVLTAMAACVIHVRTRAQEIFARHISGWSFVATHRRLLAVEGLIALAFVAWAVWDTLSALAAANDPGNPLPRGLMTTTGTEPYYAAAIAVASLAITVTALASFHRRIVLEGASQA